MNSKFRYRIFLAILACLSLLALISGRSLLSEEAHAQPQIKVAVLEKMSKGQSARRLGYLYPSLTTNFREAFSQDGRFELISQEEVNRALASLGIAKEKIDPDDAIQLQKVGRQAGADLVFVSYYYEMCCHGLPMHSNNVLSLAKVSSREMEKIAQAYDHELSGKELASSDALIFKELLNKAKQMITDR